MKTREEVDALKRDWEKDPCWDIEKTEGFEEYYEELLGHHLACEEKWEDALELKRRRRLLQLYSMNFGEELFVADSRFLRVPGGWVVRSIERSSETGDVTAMAACFIPYSDEFNPKVDDDIIV